MVTASMVVTPWIKREIRRECQLDVVMLDIVTEIAQFGRIRIACGEVLRMEDGGGAIEWNWFAESTSLSSVAGLGGIGRGIGRGFGRIVCDTISGSRSR